MEDKIISMKQMKSIMSTFVFVSIEVLKSDNFNPIYKQEKLLSNKVYRLESDTNNKFIFTTSFSNN